MVAFRAKPTDSDRKRLLMACEAYKAHLPRQDSLPASIAVGDQMITIWPLTDPDAPEATSDDCNFMLDHYDFYGGISAVDDAKRQNSSLSGPGPFLIGWSPSNSRKVPNALVLVVLVTYVSRSRV
jgi:hypothetical protein